MRTVFSRAWKDTRRFLVGDAPGLRLLLNLLLYAVAVWVVGLIDPAQVSSEARWGIALLAAGVIFFVPTYLVNLWAAPYRMWKEAEAKLALVPTEPRIRLVSEPVATARTQTYWVGEFLGKPGHESRSQSDWRFHITQSDDGVSLVCQAWGQEIPPSAICEVEDPSGTLYTGKGGGGSDSSLRYTYPSDFGVDTPQSGLHFVYWRAADKDLGFREAEGFRSIHDLEFTIEVEGSQQ